MSSGNSVQLRREVYAGDVECMAGWMEDREVTRFLNEKPGVAKNLRRILRTSPMNIYTHHFNKESRFYMIDYKSKQTEPVGFLRLIPKMDNKVEMVVVIADKDKWNNGLGTSSVKKGLQEAFFNLRCEKVEAKIHPENGASKRVFRKAGFRKKGEQAGSKLKFQLSMEEYLKSIHS